MRKRESTQQRLFRQIATTLPVPSDTAKKVYGIKPRTRRKKK